MNDTDKQKIDTRYSCVDELSRTNRKKTLAIDVQSIAQEDGEWAIVRGPVHGFGECEPFARHSGSNAEIWIDAAGELRVDAPRNMPGSVCIPRWVLNELFEHERKRKARSTRPPPPFAVEAV